MAVERKDPYLSNRFEIVLEIDGIHEANFSECAGLVIETEVEERHEGGLNQYVHRFPKGSKVTNIVLKRGLTDSDRLWKWHAGMVAGTVERKDLSIVLFDVEGTERWRWNVSKAYPVKWTGPDLKADASGIAIETLELVHHGISKG